MLLANLRNSISQRITFANEAAVNPSFDPLDVDLVWHGNEGAGADTHSSAPGAGGESETHTGNFRRVTELR